MRNLLFKIPESAYEKFEIRNCKGIFTKYRFNYTDSIFSSMDSLQRAYKAYMQDNTGFDYYDEKTSTFIRQCPLFGSEVI